MKKDCLVLFQKQRLLTLAYFLVILATLLYYYALTVNKN